MKGIPRCKQRQHVKQPFNKIESRFQGKFGSGKIISQTPMKFGSKNGSTKFGFVEHLEAFTNIDFSVRKYGYSWNIYSNDSVVEKIDLSVECQKTFLTLTKYKNSSVAFIISKFDWLLAEISLEHDWVHELKQIAVFNNTNMDSEKIILFMVLKQQGISLTELSTFVDIPNDFLYKMLGYSNEEPVSYA